MSEDIGAGHCTGREDPIDPEKLRALFRGWLNLAMGEFNKRRNAKGGPTVSFPGVLFAQHHHRPGTDKEVESLRKIVNNWLNRGDAPGIWAAALTSLVKVYAPEPPANYAGAGLTFARVADLMNSKSRRSQQEGGARGESKRRAAGELGRAIRLEHAVVDPGARCSDLVETGLAAWGDQSSWITSGTVPPYVRRQVDELLWNRLDAATGVGRPADDPPQRRGSRGPVILVGEPKSGKTRTLLHALARHPSTRDLGYWRVRARTNAVQQIITALSETRTGQPSGSGEPASDVNDLQRRGRREIAEPKTVVVFDDLHHHLRLGFSDTDLDRLIDLGAVVVGTLHSSTLRTMRRMVAEGPTWEDPEALLGIASPRLVHQLEQATIRVPAELTTEELNDVEGADLFVRLYELGYADPLRLAEILAAVNVLEARAGEGCGRPTRSAILDAALHATVIHPTGATLNELSVLHRWAFERVERIRPWSSDAFREAYDWATTPVGGAGSSHALLIPSPDRAGAYRLLDALVPRIADLTSGPDPLGRLRPHRHELAPECSFHAGNHAFFVLRDLATARDWWTHAAGDGHPSAMYNLGVFAHWDDDLKQARDWWKQAAAADHVAALFNLGVIALAADDVDEARECWGRAAQHGDFTAMFNLGDLAERCGKNEAALDWWHRAAAAGNTDAMTNLGVIAQTAGQRDIALDWWHRGAAAGNTDAMTNLGLYAEDPPGARFWFLRAAGRGNAEAMFALGMLENQEGDPDEARYWWTEAASQGHPRAEAALRDPAR